MNVNLRYGDGGGDAAAEDGRGGDVGIAAAGPGMYVWMDATVVSKYRSAGGRRWFDGAAGSLDSRRGGSGTREQIGASSWWNDQR